MPVMPVLKHRHILLLIEIPGESVAIYLAHAGDRDEGGAVDLQHCSFDPVEVASARHAVDHLFIIMHVSAYTVQQSGTEPHAEQFFADIIHFLSENHELDAALLHYNQLVHDNAVDQSVKYAEYDTVCICHRYLDQEYNDIADIQYRRDLPAELAVQDDRRDISSAC